MARKTATNNDANVAAALEEWKSVTEIRHELAQEAYEAQDEATQKLLIRMVNRLRIGANGYISVRVNGKHGAYVPVKIDQEYLDFNLLYIATEILKDLAMFDIRVGTYTLPPSLCVECGAELTKEQPKRKKVRHG